MVNFPTTISAALFKLSPTIIQQVISKRAAPIIVAAAAVSISPLMIASRSRNPFARVDNFSIQRQFKRQLSSGFFVSQRALHSSSLWTELNASTHRLSGLIGGFVFWEILLRPSFHGQLHYAALLSGGSREVARDYPPEVVVALQFRLSPKSQYANQNYRVKCLFISLV